VLKSSGGPGINLDRLLVELGRDLTYAYTSGKANSRCWYLGVVKPFSPASNAVILHEAIVPETALCVNRTKVLPTPFHRNSAIAAFD